MDNNGFDKWLKELGKMKNEVPVDVDDETQPCDLEKKFQNAISDININTLFSYSTTHFGKEDTIEILQES